MRKFFFFTLFHLCLNPFLPASGFEWQTSTPEESGFSPQELEQVIKDLETWGTKSLLVIRKGKIVTEWYGNGWTQDKRHYSASLAKSLVGGLSLMLALDDKRIVLDAPACHYIPEWRADPQKAVITIRQLVTHTSGLEDAEITTEKLRELQTRGFTINDNHMDLPGWKGQFWRKDPDPFTVSRDQTPVLTTPGTVFAYSNPGMAMLSYAVTSAISETSCPDIRSLLRSRIMEPLGIKEEEWSIGYDETYRVNGLNLVASWGGGSYTARSVARIGQLMLQKGNWNGVSLISEKTVALATRYAGMPLPERPPANPFMASGLGWYCNFDGIWPGIPRDTYCGAGAGNQVLLVIPSLDLVVVRNGSNLFDPENNEDFWGGMYSRLFQPLLHAMVEPPYPASRLQAEFAEQDTIIRQAEGSDNWPSTWGDDGAIYTGYGDGWGFEPKTEIKLSLGLARITGDPEDFRGENIRSITGERTGQGLAGAKVSGLIMVDGNLYMLARNTGNATMARSADHGKSWEWADWKLRPGFGSPSFINYGQNYQGGPEDYVYIVSPEAETAYDSADGLVMARVPVKDLFNRNSYEFLAGVGGNGIPAWDKDIRLRKAFFNNPGLTYRSSMSWNPALKKFFLCQINYGDEPRFQGGFGIYESSQPWGPWKTVFYTRDWDTGPGESMNIPVKWISKDGLSIYLIFSGEDSFSVRKMQLSER